MQSVPPGSSRRWWRSSRITGSRTATRLASCWAIWRPTTRFPLLIIEVAALLARHRDNRDLRGHRGLVCNSRTAHEHQGQLPGHLPADRGGLLRESSLPHPEPQGQARGTGFLIGPDLLLTCNHVLPTPTHLEDAVALFDYVNGLDGMPSKGRAFPFTNFFHSSRPEELDYSLVRLASNPLPVLSAEEWRKKLDCSTSLTLESTTAICSLSPGGS